MGDNYYYRTSRRGSMIKKNPNKDTNLIAIQCDNCLRVLGASEMEVEEAKFCLECAKEVFARCQL